MHIVRFSLYILTLGQVWGSASLSNPSAASPTSQLILQPFSCFTYVIGTSPRSQLILQTFRRFTYSQVILQPFRYFTDVTGTSRTSPGEPSMHRGKKKQFVMD